MAKLAELNGYPGPRHVLDLVNELELSNRQKANITTIYDNMKKKAIDLGQEMSMSKRSPMRNLPS